MTARRRARPQRFNHLRDVEPVGGRRVRLFFESDKVIEVSLPWVDDASRVEVVDDGAGLGLGDGRDVCADLLATMRGKVLLPGRPGWLGSPPRKVKRRSR